MRVEVSVGNRQLMFLAVFVTAIAIVGLAGAYGGGSPSTMGHSTGEIDWSQTIPSITAGTVTANNQICIGGECRTGFLAGCDTIYPYNMDDYASTVDHVVNVPDYCMGGKTCYIILKEVTISIVGGFAITDNPAAANSGTYTQFGNNVWVAEGSKNVENAKNGDSAAGIDIVDPVSYIYLRDDSNIENPGQTPPFSPTKWTILDNSAAQAAELITCPMFRESL